MIYTGSKASITEGFVGLGLKLNATDLSECTYSLVTDAARKLTT